MFDFLLKLKLTHSSLKLLLWERMGIALALAYKAENNRADPIYSFNQQ